MFIVFGVAELALRKFCAKQVSLLHLFGKTYLLIASYVVARS